MGSAPVAACEVIGIANMHPVDGDDNKVGIWLFWNVVSMAVDIVHENAQAIHAIVQSFSMFLVILFEFMGLLMGF